MKAKEEPMTERELGELVGILVMAQTSFPEPAMEVLERAMERLAYLEKEKLDSHAANA